MAVILLERGRGKFKPAPDYEIEEVKALLNQKIEEEYQKEYGTKDQEKTFAESPFVIFGLRRFGSGL